MIFSDVCPVISHICELLLTSLTNLVTHKSQCLTPVSEA